MKRKLGLNLGCVKDADVFETMDKIKDIGFDCFFVGCGLDLALIPAICEKAKKLELDFEFIHAPFRDINTLLTAGVEYRHIMKAIKNSIDAASENGVPAVVLHISSGWTPPELSDIGLSRFDEIVLYAEQKNVMVYFENLRVIGNLAYIADRYEKCDHVRFCYDNGHEHCYTKTVCWPDIFCYRIAATHIHDNFGRGREKEGDVDLHLLPFDGNFDFEKMMRKLDEYEYQGSLTLEISNQKPAYENMTADEFLRTAFDRLKKISEM